MNVCLFGTGAVGGHIAARLIASGAANVSVIARGAQLSAIRERGLTVRRGAEEITTRPVAQTDDVNGLPSQDLVIVTLKAPALPAAAAAIDWLLAPDGVALFVTNGIPWWWNHGLPTEPGPLPLLDPNGTLWELLRERTLGCVCYGSAEVVSPGVIQATTNDRWIIGDPATATAATATISPRLQKVIDMFERARFEVRAAADLRRDVWIKLLLNASLNTVSSLTRLPSVRVCTDPELKALMIQLMQETIAVAAACGWPLQDDLDLDKLASPGNRPPDHRTSMLQDVLGSRPLETDAVLGQVAVFARAARIATPALDVVLILLRGLDRSSRP